MNIQKSRITAILSVAIIACMMVTVMAVPAFAAEVEEQAYYVEMQYSENEAISLHDAFCYGCTGEPDFRSLSLTGYLTENGDALVLPDDISSYFMNCSFNWDVCTVYPINNEFRVLAPAGLVMTEDRDDIVTFTREIPDETEPDETEPDVTSPAVPPSDPDASDSDLADLVNSETLSSVIDEILSLLPTIVPVIVVFIGLRKGISFMQNVLNNG